MRTTLGSVALGMIVRDFVSAEPILAFLDNAEKFGHGISHVIVAYSHRFDWTAVQILEGRARLSLVKLHDYEKAKWELGYLNLRQNSISDLLYCPLLDGRGLIPYGFNRNHVLLEALFEKIDVLIFVDSDVQPAVLRRRENGTVCLEEIDFVGAHLRGMEMGADITSSDYSGYSILPPADFDGMSALLYGLHKEEMCLFWHDSKLHRGLVLQGADMPEPVSTTKVLGGNLGIRMGAFPTLPPFFSPYYFYNGVPFLARGEDTFSALPPRRIESTASISGLISSMIPMATIPRFRSCGQIAVSVIGSTMLVPDGSDGTYFSDGKPDMMRPTLTGARSN